MTAINSTSGGLGAVSSYLNVTAWFWALIYSLTLCWELVVLRSSQKAWSGSQDNDSWALSQCQTAGFFRSSHSVFHGDCTCW